MRKMSGKPADQSPRRIPVRNRRDLGPLPERHPFYAFIDRISSEWVHLERALDTIIWELALIERELGPCITGQLNGYWPRINAIMSLATAKAIDKALVREFELFGKSISKLAKKRDRLVHETWYCGDEGTTIQLTTFTDKKNEQLVPNSFSKGNAYALISEIDAKIIELWQLHSRLRSDLENR
jgi:hypothetical protein